MRFSTASWLFVSLFTCSLVSAVAQTNPTSSTFIDPRDTLRRQLEDEKRRTLDPLLGTVPYERLAAAREKILKDRRSGVTNQSGIPGVTWQERGPNNFGGRVRTVQFDLSDGARKRVWVGNQSSGLWQTNDITDPNATWTPQSDNWENTVVTAIAAAPSNPQIVYVATGDPYSGKAGGNIWKTTTGGASWTRLSSTIPVNIGSYPSLGRAFTYIQRMVVNSSGQVFAATQYGVVRSVDGGSTWQFALSPNMGVGFGTSTGQYSNDFVNDLELASDGVLYAGFNPGRIFKSTGAAGTTWAEITPATGGERTELAVSPATSGAGQVLYAVSRAYNNVTYNQDIKWFKKSTNAGVSWTDVAIPTINSTSHFTAGNGYYNMDITAHPTDPNTVYAGGNALLRSIDGGAGWTKLIETATNNSLYSQTGLQCTPGGTGFVNTCDQGIFWSADGANVAVVTPTIASRNNGFRNGEAYTVVMKGSLGSNYFMANVQPQGIITMNAPNGGIGTSNGTIWGTGSTNIPHINTDESNIQIFSGYSSVNVYNGLSYQEIFTITNSPFTADYDSQANTLYTYDYVNSQHIIRRTTGIGTSPVNTTLVLTGVSDQPLYMRLGNDRTTLFAGGYNGKLYRITAINQATPVVTTIDNGVFGANTTISSIGVGATDNELLVTLSNYGTQSVWYTADGGGAWTGKDQSNHGLPDVPVRTALFNPQNRQQVLLGTDLGVWSTTNILASNPGWGAMGGSMPLNRVNQLRYRASDGKLAAATVGRGIWTTDAFAIPYTLPTVAITGVSAMSLCAGSSVAVNFTTTGTFNTGNQFEVWVSDAIGSFVNQKRLGTGTSSPVSVTLPTTYNALPYGTNYQVKVVATNPGVESSPSAPLAIGNLENVVINDRIGNSSGNAICEGGQATFTLKPQNRAGAAVAVDRYQWNRYDGAISGATSASYTATQSGPYTGTVFQAGCMKTSSTYNLYTATTIYPYIRASTDDINQCVDSPVSLSANYNGDNASYQWNKDGVGIPGATAVTYIATQTGRYDVFVQDRACTRTTNFRQYEFGSAIEAKIFFGTPADSLICASSPASAYMYLASASKFSSIQWYKNGVAVTGETGSYFYANGPGVYAVAAQQGSCRTNTNALTRTSAPAIPIRIQFNGATSLCPGETRTLYAQSAINTSYQWQANGVDIPSASSSQYTISSSGAYSVRDTSPQGCGVTSEVRSFTFSSALQPQIVVSYLTSTAICGPTYLYDLNTYNTSTSSQLYTYQWQKDGVNLPSINNYAQYVDSPGLYTVRVTNGASCSGVSKGIYIQTSNPPRPLVAYQTLERCANNVVQLSNYNVSGSLRWKMNGALILGVVSNSYNATQSGRYSYVLTNGYCTVESAPVDVKIGEPTAATIVGAALVNAGQTALLPISFSGPTPWSLTLSNGQSATAITQNPYLMPVTPTATTTYSILSVVNACGTGTTAGSAVVTVGTGSADISLAMAVGTRTPKMGEVVSYSLNVANAGPTDAAGLQVESLLPAGVSFLDAVSSGITHSNGVVSVAAGSVLAGMTNAFVFRATITSPGTLATAAQITASQTPDPDSQPNSGTGDGQDDTAQADLRTADQNGPLLVSANPNQVPLPRLRSNQPAPVSSAVELSLQLDLDKLVANVAQQEAVTATITVRNRGGIPATGVVVRMLLPNGVPFPALQTGWQTVDAQTLNGYLSTIPAGGSATIKLLWRPAGEGILKAQILDVIETPYASTPGNGYVLGEKDDVQSRIRVR